jgi:hypothetical protein
MCARISHANTYAFHTLYPMCRVPLPLTFAAVTEVCRCQSLLPLPLPLPLPLLVYLYRCRYRYATAAAAASELVRYSYLRISYWSADVEPRPGWRM